MDEKQLLLGNADIETIFLVTCVLNYISHSMCEKQFLESRTWKHAFVSCGTTTAEGSVHDHNLLFAETNRDAHKIEFSYLNFYMIICISNCP